GTASVWQDGPLASQARVEMTLEGSQRLIFDVTAFKDGTLSVDAQFNNDRAMEATGGRANYGVTVTMDGQVLAKETVSQGQYENWHRSFQLDEQNGGQGLGDAQSGWLNIRHDIAHLQQTGAVANYDLGLKVSEAVLSDLGNTIGAPGWDAPLAANGVTQYMPGTGGRGDIGFTTFGNTTWLLSQDARAAEYALGQAEAASAIPWHHWDARNDSWLSTDDYPRLWTDGRGGQGRPGDASSGSLVQFNDGQSGWVLDSSHQPDLSFVPYLLTGERWILDNLNAQASWNILAHWPEERSMAEDLVVNGNQVRGAAWSLRQIDNAAFAAPDGSAEKAYFTAASESNWKWLVSQIPTWTEQQGEAHGWVPGVYGTAGALPPWQQDYFASTAIAAAERGNADALTLLDWMSNFLIGRFQHEADGLPQHDGAAYLIANSDPVTGEIYKTWAEIGAQTQARGWSNGEGWAHTDGNYAQLALATLSGLAQLTGNAEAAALYHELLAENPPMTGGDIYANDPTFALAPPDASNMPTERPVPSAPSHEAPAPELPQTDAPALETPAHDAPAMAPLSIVLSGDSWQGDAIAVVKVDGVEAWRGAVSAQHGSSGMEVALGDVSTDRAHDVTVSFINDGWGGHEGADRNLYVDDILVGGASTGSKAEMFGNGDEVFTVAHGSTAPSAPEASTPAAPAVAPLSIVLSGDSWQGDAIAVVSVNGVEAWRGGVSAQRGSSGMEVALGDVSTDRAHDVTVSFINDAWGGHEGADRNLYVDDILLGGASTGSSAELFGNGDEVFTVAQSHSTPPSAPVMAPLSIVLSGDSWQGDAIAVVTMNGEEAWRGAVSAQHGFSGMEVALGDVMVGQDHAVTVSFINDAWGGHEAADRNLYVDDILLGGVSTGDSAALLTNGDAYFSIDQHPVVHTDAVFAV
ncbi:carbohydrate-binding domain-containing protein, partial [Roseomonas marmotae]